MPKHGAPKISEPDGRHDDGKLRIAEDRAHHSARPACRTAPRRDRAGEADPVIEPENADEGEGEKPPSIIRSPCAKFTTLGGPVDKDETSRDQAENAAERNAAHHC